jgi:hypothetical protein
VNDTTCEQELVDFSVAEADLPKLVYLLNEGIWYAEHLRDPGDEEAAAFGRNLLQVIKPIWAEIEAEKQLTAEAQRTQMKGKENAA